MSSASRRAAKPGSLFAYGTLQVSEILEALYGVRLAGRPAVLEGFERRRLAGEIFPAVRPCPGAETHGLLYEGLTQDAAWAALDAFEGELYERRRLRIRIGLEYATADVYVIRREAESLLSGDAWDLREFRERHADAYIDACRELRRRVRCG